LNCPRSKIVDEMSAVCCDTVNNAVLVAKAEHQSSNT